MSIERASIIVYTPRSEEDLAFTTNFALTSNSTNTASDGKGMFPLVMVGGVLEANRRWDIGKEVINCISKHFPGVQSIRPQVEPAVGAAWLAWNSFMKEFHKEICRG